MHKASTVCTHVLYYSNDFAYQLLLIGSSNGATERSPIQESFSLDTPVQVILDEKPEVFKKFKQLMDEKDVWGNNGWKRLALFHVPYTPIP